MSECIINISLNTQNHYQRNMKRYFRIYYLYDVNAIKMLAYWARDCDKVISPLDYKHRQSDNQTHRLIVMLSRLAHSRRLCSWVYWLEKKSLYYGITILFRQNSQMFLSWCRMKSNCFKKTRLGFLACFLETNIPRLLNTLKKFWFHAFSAFFTLICNKNGPSLYCGHPPV